jgi:hypothetical protein
MGIFQDLVDVHGFPGGYQSVKRYVRKLRGAGTVEPRAIIQTQPGEELFLAKTQSNGMGGDSA